MIRTSVTELKDKLSKYLRLVKQGETIEIVERTVPIARIEGIAEPGAGQDDLRERLIRDGIVSAARTRPDPRLLSVPPVPCRADPAAVLIEERGDR